MKKKETASPKVERYWRYGSTCAMSSTSGPMTMPITISITTVGSTTRRETRDSSAPRLDAEDERQRAQVRRDGLGGHR